MKTRMKFFLHTIGVLVFFSACHEQTNSKREKKYLNFKSEFNQGFIDQFPDKTHGIQVTMNSKTNIKKNDVGLFLYEKSVGIEYLNNIIKKIKANAIATYNPLDTCLLVVNRFDTSGDFEKITIDDSSLVNNACYASRLPIPNFKDDDCNSCKFPNLDPTFAIYVLECNQRNPYNNKYSMLPNPQMPTNWKSGYSKGIAISEKQRTVVYWSIMW